MVTAPLEDIIPTPLPALLASAWCGLSATPAPISGTSAPWVMGRRPTGTTAPRGLWTMAAVTAQIRRSLNAVTAVVTLLPTTRCLPAPQYQLLAYHTSYTAAWTAPTT